MSEQIPPPGKGYYRLKQVLNIIPVSKSTWWDGVKKGRFPQPIKLGERIALWRVEDILSLVEDISNQSKENGQ